jgi:hypothetical protein
MPTTKLVICSMCKLQFQKTVQQINNCKKRGDKNHFCSKKCVTEFYKNKHIVKCDFCKKEFKRIPSQLRFKNKFCSRSCSAKFNNIKRIKSDFIAHKACNICKNNFEIKRRPSGTFSSKKICPSCVDNNINSINMKTKGDLFLSRKNWQSARSIIQKNANKTYLKSNNSKKCKICGYDLFIEIAHIKSVSSFPATTLISEINSIDNLIALCRNHHWEYDNGFLNLVADERIELP